MKIKNIYYMELQSCKRTDKFRPEPGPNPKNKSEPGPNPKTNLKPKSCPKKLESYVRSEKFSYVAKLF